MCSLIFLAAESATFQILGQNLCFDKEKQFLVLGLDRIETNSNLQFSLLDILADKFKMHAN